MCSTCYVKRLAMMQASPYSIYDDYYERQLQYIYTKCGLKGNTTVPNSLMPELEDNSLDYGTDEWYTTSTGETCDSIGFKRGVSSASLFIVNQYRLPNCSRNSLPHMGTLYASALNSNRTIPHPTAPILPRLSHSTHTPTTKLSLLRVRRYPKVQRNVAAGGMLQARKTRALIFVLFQVSISICCSWSIPDWAPTQRHVQRNSWLATRTA